MTITLKCRSGHKVDAKTPTEAEALAFTACQTCFKPLFVTAVKS